MVAPDLFGEVSVNGFRGCAKFRIWQRWSTISPRVAQGLPTFMHRDGRGNNRLAVNVDLVLGSNLLKKTWRLYVYENDQSSEGYHGSDSGSEHDSEVVFGADFRNFFQTYLKRKKFAPIICSPRFGEIQCASEPEWKFDLDKRVILLVDMDCFAVQVYGDPDDVGQPRAVFNGPVIESVSYEAKQAGVKRRMTREQARRACPNLIEIENPKRRNGRPDKIPGMTATANIKKSILKILNQYGDFSTFEFASKDEFYIDLTEVVDKQEYRGNRSNLRGMIPGGNDFWSSVYIYGSRTVGHSRRPTYLFHRLPYLRRKSGAYTEFERQEIRLLYGTWIGSQIVNNILEDTGYQASIGVGSNKVTAKIASDTHKPGSITVFPPASYDSVAEFIDFQKVPGFSANLGDTVRNEFETEKIQDLQYIKVNWIANLNLPGNNGNRKYLEGVLLGAHFICDEIVEPIDGFKTASCNRNFKYGEVSDQYIFEKMLMEQYEEMLGRLRFEHRVNGRLPYSIKLAVKLNRHNGGTSTKSFKISGSPISTVLLKMRFLKMAFIGENNRANYGDSILPWDKNIFSGVSSIGLIANFEQ